MWQQIIEECQLHEAEVPIDFKDYWATERKKSKNHNLTWNLNISSWITQKQESIARAQAQADIDAEAQAVREKEEAAKRKDQEEANTRANVARDKVAAATIRVDEARSRLATAHQAIEQTAALAYKEAKKITETENVLAGLSRELEAVNQRIRDAHARAERQKYSFRNAVGISHSRQTALEDKRQAEAEVGPLRSQIEQIQTGLAKIKKEDLTKKAEVERAKVLLTQAEAEITRATETLARLKKEESEANRWAALTPAQRADEQAAEEARAIAEFEAKRAAEEARAIAEFEAKRDADIAAFHAKREAATKKPKTVGAH